MDLTNRNTSGEVERLAWLVEEMGEAQQAAGKILRHGYIGKDPDGNKYYNREKVVTNLGTRSGGN